MTSRIHKGRIAGDITIRGIEGYGDGTTIGTVNESLPIIRRIIAKLRGSVAVNDAVESHVGVVSIKSATEHRRVIRHGAIVQCAVIKASADKGSLVAGNQTVMKGTRIGAASIGGKVSRQNAVPKCIGVAATTDSG